MAASETTTSGTPLVHVIHTTRGWRTLNLGELWTYRELLFFLTWRNILVRYKQAVLGISWAILQPVFMMVVFSIFFGHLAKLPSSGLPYPIFSYAGLLPWTFFANSLAQASNSLVGNSNLIGKVYFPRLALPLAAVMTTLVDFAIAFVVLVGMMTYYGIWPSWRVIWVLPLLLALSFITALGVGLWLASLNVAYRDVQYVLPFVIQIWMFASPVVYAASIVPARWRVIYGLNPMAGVISGFRWSLLNSGPAPGAMVGVSAAVALLILISGALYFTRMEKTFADVV